MPEAEVMWPQITADELAVLTQLVTDIDEDARVWTEYDVTAP